MSERYRNDLYYIERMSGYSAIHPDGTVGEIQEKKVTSVKTIKGRREDRVRKVRYQQEKLVQTKLYESASKYRAADKARLAKAALKYDSSGVDPSWSIEDMPDRVLAKFNKWQDKLEVPHYYEIMKAAGELTVNSDELQNATITCMWCKGDTSQYACRGCGRSGAYYKYPVVRLLDDEGYCDQPFDVAWYIQTNPDAFSYEIRTKFNHEGKMAAEQIAVLRVGEMSGLFAGRDRDHVMRVDPADQLHGEIVIKLAEWREDPRWPYRGFKPLGTSDPLAVIEALQKKCALDLVRERLDNEEYQEYYNQFTEKLRALGSGAMTAVIASRNAGQGEVDYELLFGHMPFENSSCSCAVHSFETRELFKKVLPLINIEKGTVDIWWEGGY